jgi:hypothetical protein
MRSAAALLESACTSAYPRKYVFSLSARTALLKETQLGLLERSSERCKTVTEGVVAQAEKAIEKITGKKLFFNMQRSFLKTPNPIWVDELKNRETSGVSD